MVLKNYLLATVLALSACGKAPIVVETPKTSSPSVSQQLKAYAFAPESLSVEQSKQLLLEGALKLGPTHELVRQAVDSALLTNDGIQSLELLKALLASSDIKIKALKNTIRKGLSQKDIPLLRFALRASLNLSADEQLKLGTEQKKLIEFLSASKGLELSSEAQKKISAIQAPVKPDSSASLKPQGNVHSNLLFDVSRLLRANKVNAERPDNPAGPVICTRTFDCFRRDSCLSNSQAQTDIENKNMIKIQAEIENLNDQIAGLEREQNRIRMTNEPELRRLSALKQKRSESNGRLEVAQMNLNRLADVLLQLHAINSRSLSAELASATQKALSDLSVSGNLAEFQVYDLLASAQDDESKKQLRALLDILQTVGLNALLSQGDENSSVGRLNANESLLNSSSSILSHYFTLAKALVKDLAQVEQSLSAIGTDLINLQGENINVVAAAEQFLKSTEVETQSLANAIASRELDVSRDDDKIKVLKALIGERNRAYAEAMQRRTKNIDNLLNVCPKIACEFAGYDCT